MTTLSIQPGALAQPLVVHIGSVVSGPMTTDEFWRFCLDNPDLSIERSASGNLEIMTPTGGNSGWRGFELAVDLGQWRRRDGTGIAFDAATSFVLPSGAVRSPDAAWVSKDRWNALTAEQQATFPPLAPDFVAEIRSRTDRLSDLQAKMIEWRDGGVRLGWLIDPQTRTVWVYEPGQKPRKLDDPTTIDGGSVLPGFTLELKRIWEPG